MSRFHRLIVSFLAASAFLHPATPEPAHKPKLLLAIIVDQFRYDYLLRFRADYRSGLARLLDKGAVFTDAHYLHSTTVTAVGHSTFLSGATPSISGIIANEWFDRESRGSVTSVSDPKTQLVGSTAGTEGSSPRRLLVSTVPDEIKLQGLESKTIGISIKDRGAILPSGHTADAAYWYDSDSNRWVTSSYYRSELPEWAQAVNNSHPSQRALGASWFPVDAKGTAVNPFCSMVNGTAARYCGSLEATPWGNEMIEEFAESAVAGEKLGRHAGVDVLTVSFSSNDYVGHAVGPDDPAVRDISIRTDRLLGKLLDYIDQNVGAGNTLVVLSADHGVAPVPEVNQARKMPGGRLSPEHLVNTISEALSQHFGAGKWIVSVSEPSLYLNLDLIREKKLDPAEVERVAADAAKSEPHIARAYTRHELLQGNVQRDSIGNAVTFSFYGPRSGDVVIVQEPYYLFGATGTTHGTPYDYDNHVPLIFFGPGIKTGVYRDRVAINDVAPTLSVLLGVETPSGSAGRVLNEILE